MSSNFDWRAEDDVSWDKYSNDGSDGEQPTPRRKRPIWLIALLVLAVLLSATFLGYRQVRRYVENTESSVEEDVLSSHALVKLAALEGDLELFAPLLSGRDPAWTQDQLTILDNNLLFDRQPFGLVWRPEQTSDDISVSLSNDLQSAEIEYVETYGYGLNGEEGEVQLVQTAVYRLSETRWLLAPPAEDFWGNWIASKGRHVTLTFPERDEEIGMELASDLEATLAGACTNLALDCDQAAPLEVLLETDLDAVLAASNPEHFAGEGDQFILPAPTLVGNPANNVSYRALYRGYAAFIVSRLIAQQAEWECCDQSPFFKALVDVQLHQLNLQSWPLSPADYRLALRQSLGFDAIRELRNQELSLVEYQVLPDWQLLYLFIEYVASREDIPPIIEIQRTLARTDSLGAWLTQAGITGNLNLLAEDWQRFIHRRIIANQGPPPVSWPEEDLALICGNGQTSISNIYRYNPAQNKWSIELADRDFVIMNGLPNNEGLILTEQFLDTDQFRTTLYREGQETAVVFGDNLYYSTEWSDPNGRYLILKGFQQFDDTDSFFTNSYLLDLENCTSGDCPLAQIESRSIWSPDGENTLWSLRDIPDTVAGADVVFIGDDKAQNGRQIGAGIDPFWLDNEHFAYLQGSVNVVLAKSSTSDDTAEQLLDAEALAALISDLEASDIELTGATADPTAPDLIYVTAANRLENIDYLFTFDWRTGEIALVFATEDSPGGLLVPQFSPDHRWLVLRTNFSVGNSTGIREQDVYLFNTDSQETMTYNLTEKTTLPEQSWSNDSEWLAFLGDGFIILSAPNADYDHLITHEFNDCTGIAWIN